MLFLFFFSSEFGILFPEKCFFGMLHYTSSILQTLKVHKKSEEIIDNLMKISISLMLIPVVQIIANSY